MPLQHAVLTLLADGPSHGYELKGRFEETIGPQWGGLNIGHLYQILERLIRDGLVAGTPVAQPGRPDKVTYTLTPAGAAELRDWASRPWTSPAGHRDELFLKLHGAARLGPAALAGLIAAQRRGYLTDLGGLARLRRDHADDPLKALLIDAAIARTKADLEIVDSAETRLAVLAERAGGVHTTAADGAADSA